MHAPPFLQSESLCLGACANFGRGGCVVCALVLCARRVVCVCVWLMCRRREGQSAICGCQQERRGGSRTRTDSSSAAERPAPMCACLPGCCCCRCGLCSNGALCTSQHASWAAYSACCCAAWAAAVVLALALYCLACCHGLRCGRVCSFCLQDCRCQAVCFHNRGICHVGCTRMGVCAPACAPALSFPAPAWLPAMHCCCVACMTVAVQGSDARQWLCMAAMGSPTGTAGLFKGCGVLGFPCTISWGLWCVGAHLLAGWGC